MLRDLRERGFIVPRPRVVGFALALAAGTALIAPMMPATPAWAFVGIKCTSLGFVSAPPPGGPYPLDGAVAALGGCDGNTGGKGVFTFSTTGPQIITWA